MRRSTPAFASNFASTFVSLTFVILLCAGLASPPDVLGWGGPNEGGTLILHADTGTVYTEDGEYCGLSGLADCGSAEVRVEQAEPVVAHVLAAFFPGSGPRLSGLVFGIDYPANIVLLGHGACGDFELPQDDWPASGSGTAVTFAEAQTDDLVEVYWFAAYSEYAQPGRLELGAHPTQGGLFADDSIPGYLDPIAGFGALGFSTDGTLVCPASPGACCFGDGSCELLRQDPCEVLEHGTWYPDVTCDPNPCPPPQYGACCFESGNCQFTLEEACGTAGGTWFVDVPCDPNPCPRPPEGACCYDNGSCVVRTAYECEDTYGTYQGDETSCDPNQCPQPEGACCFPSGECEVLTPDECDGAGGGYQGNGTLCEPNPCTVETEGACCLTLGSCEFLPESVCGTEGGAFLGVGTLCSPNPCPQPCEPFDLAGRPSTSLPRPGVDPFRTGTRRDDQIGPNAGGVLVLHLGPALAYSEDGFRTDCDLGGGIDGCEDIIARTDQEEPVLVYAVALFPTTSAPRLLGLTFGIDFPDCVQLLEWESCGDFEIADDDWPSPGSGTAMTWTAPQRDFAVPVYRFVASGLAAEPGELALAPHPTQGAVFADDSVPSILDPIASLGSFGFFRDGVVPCPQPQEAIGACCFDDGTCRILTIPGCSDAGGDFFGVNVACTPNPCPQPPEGACCHADGVCRVLTLSDCTSSGGGYLGNDTTCDPNPCPQPGACCFPSGNCSILQESDCGVHGGTFQGDNTTCSPNPCPQPTGACCIGETCEVLTAGDCSSSGGSWFGADYPCDPNPCLEGVGACCFSDGSCRYLSESECADEGGSYLADQVPCDPNPCPTGGEGCPGWMPFETRMELRRQGIEARAHSDVPYATETGRASGRTSGLGTTGSCGTLYFNADGTYENGYAWQYGGVEPPMYGAFSEWYSAASLKVCAVVLDLTTTGEPAATMDLYVWGNDHGYPGVVLGLRTGVDPGAIAFWPSVSRHSFAIYADCADEHFVGYWGNWPGSYPSWYVGADLDGFGGCPLTNIAPGIGYPTGWQNVSVVWGPTQAIGIGAEFEECGTIPVQESSWGKVKALFR
ncbi:MAG: hypothetical protein R3E97_05495 [Candidatus Eisenbacteria bacterium]